MKNYLTLICLFLLKTSISQIDSPIDTVADKRIKKEITYWKQTDLRPYKVINGLKEFNKDGRIIYQEIYVNAVDTPEFINRFYYQNNKINRWYHCLYDDSTKIYTIIDSTIYNYSGDRLASIRNYKYGSLNGKVIYTYSGADRIDKFWFYFNDTLSVQTSRESYYHKDKLTKAIHSTDTTYYYYDILGRDSLIYARHGGMPMYKDKYKHYKRKTIMKHEGIAPFKNDSYKKIYLKRKDGKLKKYKDNWDKRHFTIKYKYYKRGPYELIFQNSKGGDKKTRYKRWTYYYYVFH